MSYFANYGEVNGSMGIGTYSLPDVERGRGSSYGQSARFAAMAVGTDSAGGPTYVEGTLVTQATPNGVEYYFKTKDGKQTKLEEKDFAKIVSRQDHERTLIHEVKQVIKDTHQERTELIKNSAHERQSRFQPYAIHDVQDSVKPGGPIDTSSDEELPASIEYIKLQICVEGVQSDVWVLGTYEDPTEDDE